MKPIYLLLTCLLLLALPLTACAQESAAPSWTTLGEGANEMALVLVLPDNQTRLYKVYSNETTLLTGLEGMGLIETQLVDDAPVITTVDGITAQDGAYWFIAIMDEAQQQFVPLTLPLQEAPFAQSYAFGLITTETAP